MGQWQGGEGGRPAGRPTAQGSGLLEPLARLSPPAGQSLVDADATRTVSRQQSLVRRAESSRVECQRVLHLAPSRAEAPCLDTCSALSEVIRPKGVRGITLPSSGIASQGKMTTGI